MTFTFNDGIPFATNNPSSDQPIMLANNVANKGIWEVDHVGFNVANGGTHLQSTFGQFAPLPTVVGGTPGSVAYPGAGIADATRAQYYFKNSNTTVPISLIRAYGAFDGNGVIVNAYNLTALNISPGVYTMTITNNATANTAYGVLVTAAVTGLAATRFGEYTINSTTQFSLAFYSVNAVLANPDFFTVIVLQI